MRKSAKEVVVEAVVNAVAVVVAGAIPTRTWSTEPRLR